MTTCMELNGSIGTELDEGVLLDNLLREKYENISNGEILTKIEAAEYWLKLGHESFDKQNYEKALKYYKRVLSTIGTIENTNPLFNHPGKYQEKALQIVQSAWMWMGTTYQAMGKKDQALQSFETEKFYSTKCHAHEELINQEYTETKIILITGIILFFLSISINYNFLNYIYYTNFILFLTAIIIYFTVFYKQFESNSPVKKPTHKQTNNSNNKKINYTLFSIITIISIIIFCAFLYSFLTGSYFSATWQRHASSILFPIFYIPLQITSLIIHSFYSDTY
jgi:tetratricopeptide (TPR) repeat protein